MHPYKSQALDYLSTGLGYPIPSADPFAKFPPLTGWTGKDGHIPALDQVEIWRTAYPQSNILLRLAKDVVGIDIDNYDDKHGATAIHKAQREHGRLPQTYRSTARGNGISGIYYYRLTGGMDESLLKGDLGHDSHVEVIRHSHRYAVVPPSWHQGAAAEYKWYPEAPLSKKSLPALPIGWYVHLTKGCECFRLERAEHKRTMERLYSRPSGEAGAEAARRDLNDAAEALCLTSAGSRNNTLSSFAGRFLLYDVVMHSVLDMKEVIDRLVTAGKQAGLDEQEIERTIESAMEWALREGNKK